MAENTSHNSEQQVTNELRVEHKDPTLKRRQHDSDGNSGQNKKQKLDRPPKCLVRPIGASSQLSVCYVDDASGEATDSKIVEPSLGQRRADDTLPSGATSRVHSTDNASCDSPHIVGHRIRATAIPRCCSQWYSGLSRQITDKLNIAFKHNETLESCIDTAWEHVRSYMWLKKKKGKMSYPYSVSSYRKDICPMYQQDFFEKNTSEDFTFVEEILHRFDASSINPELRTDMTDEDKVAALSAFSTNLRLMGRDLWDIYLSEPFQISSVNKRLCSRDGVERFLQYLRNFTKGREPTEFMYAGIYVEFFQELGRLIGLDFRVLRKTDPHTKEGWTFRLGDKDHVAVPDLYLNTAVFSGTRSISAFVIVKKAQVDGQVNPLEAVKTESMENNQHFPGDLHCGELIGEMIAASAKTVFDIRWNDAHYQDRKMVFGYLVVGFKVQLALGDFTIAFLDSQLSTKSDKKALDEYKKQKRSCPGNPATIHLSKKYDMLVPQDRHELLKAMTAVQILATFWEESCVRKG